MAQRDISRQDETRAVTERVRTKLVSLKTVSRPTAIAYLAGLLIAEAVTVWGLPLLGTILYAGLLVVLLTQAYHATQTFQRMFYSSVALVPLIRMLSLVLPLQSLPQYAWYPLVLLPLSLAVWLVVRFNRVDSGMLGLNARSLPLQLLIGMTGLVIGLVQYTILRPPPLLQETGWILLFIWPLVLMLLVLSAFLEEFIFRGLIQYSALRNLGWFGLVFGAMLYAVQFLGYYSLLNLFFVFFVSLLYGGIALRTGSILGVSISHALVNVLVFMFFPYLVALPFFLGGSGGSGLPLPTGTPLPVLASPTPLPAGSLASPTPCPPPIGWVSYLVEPGDTLESVNQQYGSTMEEFLKANCLTEIVPIQVGQLLNVPPVTPQPDSLAPFVGLTITPIPTASPAGSQIPTQTSLPTETPQVPQPSPTDLPTQPPTEPPSPVPPRPSPTPRPTQPSPPTPTSIPPSPTEPPPPTPTPVPPSPTEPPPPTNPPPPTQAPTPTSAPTEPDPTQPATPTSAPTEEARPTRRPTKTPRPS